MNKNKKGLVITGIELNDKGETVMMKGTYSKVKKEVVPNNKIFSEETNKIITWAELELDYIGG